VIDVRTWGTTEAERRASCPADRYLDHPDDVVFRGVDVDAPAAVTFRWLCQLQKGPYSYDLLDNLGRRSPRKLIPGLENLELGQQFMTIYELIDFERPTEGSGQITVRTNKLKGPFGTQAVTYEVSDNADGGTRLVAKRVPSPAPARFRTRIHEWRNRFAAARGEAGGRWRAAQPRRRPPQGDG
jgi:hypothetical protein